MLYELLGHNTKILQIINCYHIVINYMNINILYYNYEYCLFYLLYTLYRISNIYKVNINYITLLYNKYQFELIYILDYLV